MRFVYTAQPQFDPVPRPYLQLIIGGRAILALCDTGADTSSVPEVRALAAGIPFGPASAVIGVGGPVVAYRSARPVRVTITGPRRIRGSVKWTELDSMMLEPTIIRGSPAIPALIGRLDVLVRYRFTLRERDQEFELTKL